jgi:hypothetical protein
VPLCCHLFCAAVLLGPLRAITYVLMHGMLAAALGSMWVWQWPWGLSIISGAVLRMAGQLGYLVLSSLTMNENLFAVMLANVHNLLVSCFFLFLCVCFATISKESFQIWCFELAVAVAFVLCMASRLGCLVLSRLTMYVLAVMLPTYTACW